MKTEEQIKEALEGVNNALIDGAMHYDLPAGSSEEVCLEGDTEFRITIRVLRWVVGKGPP